VHTGDGSLQLEGRHVDGHAAGGRPRRAALRHGTTDAAAIRQRLIETADDVEAAGWDNRTGAGRINAYRAITGRTRMRRRSPKPVNGDRATRASR
jgi:hypothetical protein